MTTLTDALQDTFNTGNTTELREIANDPNNKIVRATTFVLIRQILRQQIKQTSQDTILIKCLNRLRSLNAPLRVLDLTPDQDGWKEAMFELACWADEQSYVLYVAMFNGQMFSVGRTEEDAIQRALDAQDSHGETVDRDKIQTLTVKGDKLTVQTWIDRVCYAFVVKQLDDGL